MSEQSLVCLKLPDYDSVLLRLPVKMVLYVENGVTNTYKSDLDFLARTNRSCHAMKFCKKETVRSTIECLNFI